MSNLFGEFCCNWCKLVVSISKFIEIISYFCIIIVNAMTHYFASLGIFLFPILGKRADGVSKFSALYQARRARASLQIYESLRLRRTHPMLLAGG